MNISPSLAARTQMLHHCVGGDENLNHGGARMLPGAKRRRLLGWGRFPQPDTSSFGHFVVLNKPNGCFLRISWKFWCVVWLNIWMVSRLYVTCESHLCSIYLIYLKQKHLNQPYDSFVCLFTSYFMCFVTAADKYLFVYFHIGIEYY